MRHQAGTTSLGAGNYQQPQLPKANMADADLVTEIYLLFMQIISTLSWVRGLFTTKYPVCFY